MSRNVPLGSTSARSGSASCATGGRTAAPAPGGYRGSRSAARGRVTQNIFKELMSSADHAALMESIQAMLLMLARQSNLIMHATVPLLPSAFPPASHTSHSSPSCSRIPLPPACNRFRIPSPPTCSRWQVVGERVRRGQGRETPPERHIPGDLRRPSAARGSPSPPTCSARPLAVPRPGAQATPQR